MRVVLVLATLLVAGCKIPAGDFTILTTKNIGSDVTLRESKQMGRTYGRAHVLVFLGIPFGQPQIDDAVNDALLYGGGHILLNAQVKSETIGLFPFIGTAGYYVEGDAVSLNALPPAEKKERPKRRRRVSDSDFNGP